MVGTDILEIKRIKKAMDSERFMQRVYTEKERAYILQKGNPYQTAAGIFCAKEAVSKALGTGIAQGVTFLDIEILCDKNGAPRAYLNGKALEIFVGNKFLDINVSISHCKTYAVAFCVIT